MHVLTSSHAQQIYLEAFIIMTLNAKSLACDINRETLEKFPASRFIED